jgi:hypothetical protein
MTFLERRLRKFRGGDIMRTIHALIEKGKKKVNIVDEGYGVNFTAMINGWQWTGFEADDELLKMMRDAIDEYFSNTEAPQGDF